MPHLWLWAAWLTISGTNAPHREYGLRPKAHLHIGTWGDAPGYGGLWPSANVLTSGIH